MLAEREAEHPHQQMCFGLETLSSLHHKPVLRDSLTDFILFLLQMIPLIKMTNLIIF